MNVHDEIALHQLTSAWSLRDAAANLHSFKDRFDVEFKLNVAECLIAIDRLPCRTLGQFRRELNGFGLVGEITISEQHLWRNRSPDKWWRVLGTLLHELLHAWQQKHGRAGSGNYHNAEFRHKARSLGLIVDRCGVTEYAPDSLFFQLLEKYRIEVPRLPSTTVELPTRGNSKLRLWMCRCPIRVRVAVPHFRAVCLDCNTPFRSAEAETAPSIASDFARIISNPTQVPVVIDSLPCPPSTLYLE